MRLIIRVLVPIVLASMPWAQDKSPGIQISIVAAMQPEAPLQVSGIQVTSNGHWYAAAVQNLSRKKVTGYEIRWVAAAPIGCSSLDTSELHTFSTPGHEVLLPKTTGKHTTKISVTKFSRIAARLKTDYLQVQVGVKRVQFADGTSWEIDSPSTARLFIPSLLTDDIDRCSQAWRGESRLEGPDKH